MSAWFCAALVIQCIIILGTFMLSIYPNPSGLLHWRGGNRLTLKDMVKIGRYQTAKKRNTKYVHSSWWRHHMETFSALLAICAGNSPVPVNSPHKGQWRGALMFTLICARINGWVNNREAGDLRCHRAHYDVIVMSQDVLYQAYEIHDCKTTPISMGSWKRNVTPVSNGVKSFLH